MFFPEALLELSQRDRHVTWLDPVLHSELTVAAAVGLVTDYEVPKGRTLILQHASLFADPGAAQNIADLTLEVISPNGVEPLLLLARNEAEAVNINKMITWTGSILVPPDWIVRAAGNFNAGAANNAQRLSVVGILIPIANIQRV